MAGQTVQLKGIILKREASGEQFHRIHILSPDHGNIMGMQRRPKPNTRATMPDLFDEVEVVLEKKNDDGFGFIKELTIHQRRRGLAKSFIALELACEWSNILMNNLPRNFEAQSHYKLLVKALDAWEKRINPEAVFFKCLFLYAHNEGYPVKSDWFEGLTHQERVSIASILNTPIAELQVEPELVRKRIEELKQYIMHHTDILL
jgi:recombinational DNA repair protein (RecF pathway)